jgi:hypothetical protein
LGGELTTFLFLTLSSYNFDKIRLVFYLDDWIFLAENKEEAEKILKFVIPIFENLKFTVNFEKSVLIPKQQMEFLGVEIDSVKMLFSVPKEKVKKLKSLLENTKKLTHISPREMARLVGKLNALRPSFVQTERRYRLLLNWLQQSLRVAGWDYEMKISEEVKIEIDWWIRNLEDWNGKSIVPQEPSVELFTDASETGWGASCLSAKAKGHWSLKERKRSINFRELLAIFLGLRSNEDQVTGKVVLVRTDSMVAVAYINHMGGRDREMSTLAASIWDWCFKRKVFLQALHIPGKDNIEADQLSRAVDRNDWKLHPRFFKEIQHMWGPHQVDLFASMLNTQLPQYFSWLNDPKALAVDAFRQDWKEINGYANPPFGLIGRVLRKVRIESARLSLVAPIWTTASWFPDLVSMLTDRPWILPNVHDVFLPGLLGNQKPVANPKWRVAVWRVSGVSSEQEVFRLQHPILSLALGDEVLEIDTTPIGEHGWDIVDDDD